MASETPGAVLGDLNRLFVEGTVSGLTDDQLLDRFLTKRDGSAFEALMARHGPMVLKVCRAVLHNATDAEDAFQATFLVLVKKGRSLRGRANVGGWLHLVAYRVAIQANAAAARRRVQERRAGAMSAMTASDDPVIPNDLLPALHEEIARLPEKIRLAVVLCDLQGMPQEQAAASLRLSERTLRRRLADGRQRLRTWLDRRGMGCGGAVLAVVRLRDSGVVIPPAWRESTLRAALDLAHSTVGAGAVSAAAQSLAHEVLKTMFVQRMTMAAAALLGAGLMALAASAALVSRREEPPGTPAAKARPAADADPRDVAGTFPARGRVLDPEGKPVVGAGVYVRPYVELDWSVLDPVVARQQGRVASTGADGRFQFALEKRASDGSYWSSVTGWHRAQIAVTAPGFAPAWVEAGDMVKRREIELRLVRDDVPVRGSVLDSRGRPVAGVIVRIRAIWDLNGGVDRDAFLASGKVDEDTSPLARRYGEALGSAPGAWEADSAAFWPGGRNGWTTGADGRFEVRGIGRDRIARLDFHGGGVANGTLDVMARPATTPPRPRPQPDPVRDAAITDRNAPFAGLYPRGTQLVGATFDYIAAPTKPLTGVVRLKGAGTPVENAIVRAVDAETHTAVTARTDAAGRFRIEGVPKDVLYQIQVTPRQGVDAFLRHWEILNDTEGLTPIETAIEVPPGVVVTGRLIDAATGRVVPPADVEYTWAPGPRPDGDSLGFSRLPDAAFGLTVPPGRGMIAAAAAVEDRDDPYVAAHLKAADRTNPRDDHVHTLQLVGHHAYRLIDLPAGSGPVKVDLELSRGQKREGRLTGPDGRPVVGAAAYGLSAREWGGTRHSRTLESQTFEVEGLEPGHPRLLVFTHATRKLVGAALLKDEDLKANTSLEVKLLPVGAITGRLVDDGGRPWAGATLDVWMTDPSRPPGAFGCSFGEKVIADAQGRFRVEAFVPGVETEVTIAVPNRWDIQLDGGDGLRKPALKPGELRDLGDVKAREIVRK